MIIHLHCLSWNEMPMLEHFFRHYQGLVSHFFVSDDGSTDGTPDYLAARSDVTLRRKPATCPDSYVLESLHVHQTSWRQSRGLADWVIVVDMDEHIHHPDLAGYVAAQTLAGVTAIPALGFQMVARAPPPPGVRLSDHLRRGAPWRQMSKLVLFRPDAISDPGFDIGRHRAAPRATPGGEIRYPVRDELLLLHYKYIGLERVKRRHAEAEARRRALDRERNWGHRYAFDDAQLLADFAAFEAEAIDIGRMSRPHDQHREPRWWRPG